MYEPPASTKPIYFSQTTQAMPTVEAKSYEPKIYSTKPIMVSHYTSTDKDLWPEPKLKKVPKPVQVEFSI
jgi:hypothetical protein